jgi:hypothetical protein
MPVARPPLPKAQGDPSFDDTARWINSFGCLALCAVAALVLFLVGGLGLGFGFAYV